MCDSLGVNTVSSNTVPFKFPNTNIFSIYLKYKYSKHSFQNTYTGNYITLPFFHYYDSYL